MKKLRKITNQFEKGGAARILDVYLKLHKNKLGEHWLWVALERIVAGEPEEDVMKDYGYEK